MKNIHTIITELPILQKGFILRSGFPFSCLTNPANVYDAIIIKSPSNASSFSPRYPNTDKTIEQYVNFINQHKIQKAIIVADNIHFIHKCPSLEYLRIIPSDSTENDFDFAPLYELKELKSVKCHTQYGDGFRHSSSVDYSKIMGLLNLNISGKGHLNCHCIPTLQSLSVLENPSHTLYELFSSKELDSLEIINSKILSLDGIEQSQRMQCLRLSHNRSLVDINSLKKVKDTLQILHIENCPKITDFSVLEEMKNLKILSLYGSNSVDNLLFVEKMEKLESFGFNIEVLNGDLSPCLKLKRAYCARGKRHYNLRNCDLPKGLLSADVGYKGIDPWRRI